ncbi:conserved hypothetical protein [Uncinocarpus reesii 1704]|uniref:Regulatory P domain-containing protein n=1 Tax=Uncinocarpus reesii (strain UAMH 1704) TaxID=336963 RepID=C4JX58_UNCRE|nr:uncharacterized protein UREG_06231 [Uncinocarpus reesii 1704]EEP81366.1 conserved hypothetical protein [Uncinocarpus reesii 1704]
MKTFSTLALLASAGVVSAANQKAMERLMDMKLRAQERMENEGYFDANKYTASKGVTKCVNGKAGEYSCDNVNLHGFLPHADIGSKTRRGNDVWGWTSPDGREFGAVGHSDGTGFVEIMKDGSLEYRGRLPTQTTNTVWRDMKLLNVTNPGDFDIKTDLTAHFSGFGSSHNIVANEKTKMIYAVGTGRKTPCQGGLFMVDVSNPAKPTSPGCANEDGYIHDAQCVIYTGPDFRYWGREICFNYNEDTLTIMDVSNRRKPKIISKTPYVGAAYTHQGWLTDPVRMEYLLLDDELDEQDGTGEAANGHTTTYIFDIKDLKKPKHTGTYQSPAKSIDHNQYVVNGLSYQSNYGSGLRVVDISSVDRDPTGKKFKQTGFFDCHPEDDEQNGEVEFFGSWSVYPYFRSGYILLNSIERGIYSLKYTGPKRKYYGKWWP